MMRKLGVLLGGFGDFGDSTRFYVILMIFIDFWMGNHVIFSESLCCVVTFGDG